VEKVKMAMTMTGLDYSAIDGNATLKAALETDVKTSVVAKLGDGYTADHVAVTFSAGSIKADIEVTPKEGSTGDALKTLVDTKKADIESGVTDTVKASPNVGNLLKPGMTAADLQVTSTVTKMTVATTTVAPATEDASSAEKATTLWAAVLMMSCSILLRN
jgi:hypothetical protein